MKTVVQSEHAEAHVQEDALISLVSGWVQHGTENFFGAQQILLDLVMRQNAMAINALREKLTTQSPGTTLLKEVAREGFANFIASQKILFDLARRQNEIAMAGVKERVGVSTPAAAIADLLRRGVETFIDLQQHFLDTAAKQSKLWMDSAASGKAFRGEGFGEFAQEEMENLVHTHRKFLDVIAEETTKANREVKGTDKATEKTTLTELARHSVDVFIEAQKQLLDTPGRQLAVNVEAASKAADAITPASSTSLTELTRRGLEDFVATQKALLEVMVEPEPASAKGGAKEHARSVAHSTHAH